MQSETIKWHITIIIHKHDEAKPKQQESEREMNGFENVILFEKENIYIVHVKDILLRLVTCYIHGDLMPLGECREK